jgi:DNA-binding transcriptional MerR regulator
MILVKMGYYTTKDVSDMLRISKMTLYRWEAAEKIPRARRHPMNKYRVYTKEDVEKIKRIVERGVR